MKTLIIFTILGSISYFLGMQSTPPPLQVKKQQHSVNKKLHSSSQSTNASQRRTKQKITQLKDLYQLKFNEQKQIKAYKHIQDFNEEETIKTIKLLGNHMDTPESLMTLLYSHWGKFNPQKALNFLQNNPNIHQLASKNSIIHSWSNLAPFKAYNWLKENKHLEESNLIHAVLFENMGKTNFNLACKKIDSLPIWQKAHALDGLLKTTNDPLLIEKIYLENTSQEDQELICFATLELEVIIMRSWLKNDFDTAIAKMAPDKIYLPLFHQLNSKKATLLLNITKDKKYTLHQIVTSWPTGDGKGLNQWLKNQVLTKDNDLALVQSITHFDKDLSSAQQIAHQITDLETQKNAYHNIYKKIYSINPHDAKFYLDNLDLTIKEKETIKNNE